MIVPGTSDPANAGAAPGSTIYYVLRSVAPITGRDLRSAPPVARPEQPAGRQLHAEQRRRAAASAR